MNFFLQSSFNAHPNIIEKVLKIFYISGTGIFKTFSGVLNTKIDWASAENPGNNQTINSAEQRNETSSSANRGQNNSLDKRSEERLQLLRAQTILNPDVIEVVLRHLEPRDRRSAAQLVIFPHIESGLFLKYKY